MHWILPCALFVAVNSFSVNMVKGNIVRNPQNSSREESMLDGTMKELQGVCLQDNNNKTANQIKQDAVNIVKNVLTYKDIVKLYKQMKDDTELILKESDDKELVSKILSLMKRDAKGICENENENARDCTDLQKYDFNLVSGVYKIYPKQNVYCEMTTDRGGWTIIQRRIDGSVNFQRTWTDYENGFGNLNGEYWLGNEHIHSLTSSDKYELRIDLTDMSNTEKYAVYKTFVVGDAASKYQLTVGDYSGNAGDQMTYHNGMKFSTTDQDNDRNGGNCAASRGPWWHNSCYYSGLNKEFKSHLYWNSFSSNSAKTAVMMIRKL
ncbi:fibrinogen-like protein A isoform X2 [Mytilus galloprovincialis]|uniref:fibrinogen-like protein A isoform X2 n=1 Tax=Mytilus galloprovincialis TaxID=29158 RepID=UPI003F7B9548